MALGLGTVSAAWASRPAIVEVNATKVVAPVTTRVFGNNVLAYLAPQGQTDEGHRIYSDRGAGLWDPESASPVPEYVELAKLAGITVARWPGGCGVHHYDWHRTVGPVNQRPNQRFGLSEFLVWCRVVGAEPLITLADYWGNHNDAADLVEYLNAPVGANPNGGKDWAVVRASEGHKEPWKVVWFEYGNETYHGDHQGKHKMTGEEYGRRFLLYRRAMKAVDSGVKLGALVQDESEWARQAVRIAGPEMDFAITHTYVPGGGKDVGARYTPRQVAQACVAADTVIRRTYLGLHKLIEEECGRTDVPLAITEYNGHFVQEDPVPYRQSLAVALRNADHLRVMLDPSMRILMANFWQFSNEYWGMVCGYTHASEPLVKQANFFVYQLYHEHFGDELLASKVDCDRWDFEGACWVPARRGQGQEYRLFEDNLYQGQTWRISEAPEVEQHLEEDGRVLSVQFKGGQFNYYHASIELPAEPLTGYRLTGWIKTQELEATQGAGFQVGDARGWEATQSCSLGGDVRGTQDWVKVVVDYVTLPDTQGITIQARRLDLKDTCSGKAWWRVESVQRFQPEVMPGVPYVEAVASRRRADGALGVMLIHKDLDANTPVTLSVSGKPVKAARAWALIGPTPEANNLGPERAIGISEVRCEVVGTSARLTLPKFSVVAVELR